MHISAQISFLYLKTMKNFPQKLAFLPQPSNSLTSEHFIGAQFLREFSSVFGFCTRNCICIWLNYSFYLYRIFHSFTCNCHIYNILPLLRESLYFLNNKFQNVPNGDIFCNTLKMLKGDMASTKRASFATTTQNAPKLLVGEPLKSLSVA